MILVSHILKLEHLAVRSCEKKTYADDVSEIDKHPFPNIAKKAIAAKERKSQLKKLELTSPKEIEIRQLPLWNENERCIPNCIARSGLFNAKNRNIERVYLKQAIIAGIGLKDLKIIFTGQELRQDDEAVWLQLIHLAKESPLGNTVDFTPYALFNAVGWSIDGGSYKRLRQCLERMQATSLSISSTQLKEGVSLSMIPMFKWSDGAGKALNKYQVKIAPELVTLFGEVDYTKIEWSQRLLLPSGIATWLHGYYGTHSKPYAIKLNTLKIGAGIETNSLAALRQLIEKALARLKAVGFLESWEIVGEVVRVKRVKKIKKGAFRQILSG